MTITGTLSHIDGRKLTIGDTLVVLRKGVDSAKYFEYLMSEVEASYEEEKGYKMVSEVKPSLPVSKATEVKGPIDQAPSANVPKLVYGIPEAAPAVKADGNGNRSQKDIDILTQWSYGQATQVTWANTNDAMALNTEQMKTRIRGLAKWYRDEVLQRNG